VTNVGDEARTLDSSSQYLYDAEGRKYETSSAIFTLPDFDKAFLENVNPGNTVTDAPLLYDVPDGFVPASIELHESLFFGGVTVALTPWRLPHPDPVSTSPPYRGIPTAEMISSRGAQRHDHLPRCAATSWHRG
jgi:hypothetical protein